MRQKQFYVGELQCNTCRDYFRAIEDIRSIRESGSCWYCANDKVKNMEVETNHLYNNLLRKENLKENYGINKAYRSKYRS